MKVKLNWDKTIQIIIALAFIIIAIALIIIAFNSYPKPLPPVIY